MARLLACPFCRELYGEKEGPRCPSCDIPLVPMASLPLSAEALAEADARGEVDPPEDRRLGFFYLGRGRGALLGVAALGLALFFTPWVSLERPDEVSLSGFDLARGSAGWLWGGAIGWFLLVPLALSRRSVNELRGLRVVAVTFALMTLGETILLFSKPPSGHQYFGYGLTWAYGLFASALVSIVGALIGVRLGGSLADLRDLPGAAPLGDRQPGEAVH